MSALELYNKGGVMMFFITALSVYVLGVILYKIWQLTSTKALDTRAAMSALAKLKAGQVDEAITRLERSRSPLSHVLASVIACRRNDALNEKQCEAEIMRVGAVELSWLERHMRGLEMASSIAPLLGLLGTVIGLIDSFSKLGTAGSRVDPAMLAGGIWEALLATAAGLAVAIAAFAAHHIFDTLIDRVRSAMQDVATQAMHVPLDGSTKVAEKPVKLITPKYVQ